MQPRRPVLLILKALAAGERWITVHPHGPSEKGQPVLIREEPDGSAKVIGGAGGSLNHLRIRGVKSKDEYAAEAAKKAAAHREQRKLQQQRDKESGLHESKQRAREVLKASLGDKHAQYVQTIAAAVGKKPEDLAFNAEAFATATPEARKKAEEQHARDVLKWARKVEDNTRKKLAEDAEARGAAGIGEVKLTSSKPEELSVQDLDPMAKETPPKGPGFKTDYAKRATAAGLTESELKEEAAAAKPEPKAPGAAADRKAKAAAVAEELKAIREPPPKLDTTAIVADREAMAVLKAGKALRAAAQEYRAKNKQIDKAREVVEPKAYLLEVGRKEIEDKAALADIEADIKTIRTRAFLGEVGKAAGGDPTTALGRHVGVGAYNSINALALAAGGAALVDRSTVDVLGIAGAAQVLARRLHNDLTPDELEDVRQAMGTFHVDHYMKASDDALRDARTWHEMAHEIELGEAANGTDLARAQELNARRRDYIGKAQRTLGVAYGEMEANAALVKALGEKKQQKLSVSLGKVSPEAAIQQLRALGLQRGEYRLEKVGASTMLTVEAGGMDRLAQPVSREDMAHSRVTMDIVNGKHDEDGWLPKGVAQRPELGLDVKPGTVPRLAKPFPDRPADVRQAVADYIGGRAADGDTAGDIIRGLANEETVQKAGDRDAFWAAVEEFAPTKGADGQQLRAEAHDARFTELADEFTRRHAGGTLLPLHRQRFQVDQHSTDALHRALAETPEGVAAFKQVGDLSAQDQRALRDVFARQYAQDTGGELAEKRARLDELDKSEPEREVEDMFGRGENPLWREWKGERDGLAAEVNGATPTWASYIETMGSPRAAYQTMQDLVRSKVLKAFADHHNRLVAHHGTGATPLKVGKATIANDIDHLAATDPEERDRRLAESRKLAAGLRERVGGRFAGEGEGAVRAKMDKAREEELAIAQSQMGLFGFDEPAPAPAAEEAEPHQAPELRKGERFSIGHQAERQVAALAQAIGGNFKPGQDVPLWQANMSGKNVGRQRAVKLIEHNKRVALGLGVGSGKTSIQLAAFTHLKESGKAKRGLFVVPSIVQAQFGAEALTLLEPGKYRWHAEPGASLEDRLAAYRDPSVDFNVVTHAGFRDDMMHLASKREGITKDQVADKLDAMTPKERADYMGALMKAEGIDHDYLAVDEGHQLLNRAGKENSRMANVMDGVGHSLPYYVSATADPTKNDVSEAFDLLQKMAPGKYQDRDAFLRRYGADTAAAKEGLRRELAQHLYTGHIEPDVKADRQQVKVALGEGEHQQLRKVDEATAKAKLARMRGDVDVDALKVLSPSSFEGVDPAQHGAVARDLNRSIGILHETAVQRAVLGGGALVDAAAKYAADRAGKPGVIFARNHASVAALAERLTKEGRRVVTLTGKDSAKEKGAKRRQFQKGQADVIIASDAGAVGANLQAGKWLLQYDTPNTAMLWNQRNGRIFRTGQTSDVELADLVPEHSSAVRDRERLATKGELRAIMTSPMEGLDDTGLAGVLHRIRAGEAEAAGEDYAPVPEDAAAAEPEPEEQHSLF